MYKKREKSFNEKGITLVALIVTIIVLVILAGVSLYMVINQDGILGIVEQAKERYEQSKARERLELALGEAKMQKYNKGLTDTELDNKITDIKGELLPKEDSNPNIQNVIIDGYIFEIDRSVPKITDYNGPADGLLITVAITGNDGWIKPGETVTVCGTIKTYSGGVITKSTATIIKGNATITDFPTTGGNYTITNISEDTDIKITATDSNGKSAEKIINILVKKDGTAPTVETLIAEAEGLKIKFTATGHDKEASGQEGSGIKNFNYKITSTQDTNLTGIPEDKRNGTFALGETVEIETTATGNREQTIYTITVTATDNCNNTTIDTNAKIATVTAIDALTIAQAKELVNENTLQKYIGTRVIDYNPTADGTWRIFYYDGGDEEHPNGYFGDGAGTLYLKMDSVEKMTLAKYTNHTPSDGGTIMKQMNPMWRDSENSLEIDTINEKCVSGLCDPKEWMKYKAPEARYAIGSPSVEMFIKAYNVYNGSNIYGCKIVNINGYGFSSYGGDYKAIGDAPVYPGKNNVFLRKSTRLGLAVVTML